MSFNYSTVGDHERGRLQELTVAIRKRQLSVGSAIFDLGKLLSEAREIIGSFSGNWGPFCRLELKMETRTALRFIEVYKTFGGRIEGAHIQTALEMLCKPHVPEAARDEAVQVAANGERITMSKARDIIRRHAGAPKRGSSAGRAEPLPGIETSDVLYKVRSGIRLAFKQCPPKKRLQLAGSLHDLIDRTLEEIEQGGSPIGRGESRQHLPPDVDEIANRAAAIRSGWSDAEAQRRRNGEAVENRIRKRAKATTGV